MSINFTFPVTVNPSASDWSLITNVTSDGSKWIFAGGGSGYKQLNYISTMLCSDGIDINVDYAFPSTSVGFNGFFIEDAGSNNQIHIGYSWDRNAPNMYIGGTNGGSGSYTTKYSSSIGSLTRTTVNLNVSKSGQVTVSFNGSQVWQSSNGFFSTSTVFSFKMQKYQEAAGNVYSGNIKSPLVTTIDLTDSSTITDTLIRATTKVFTETKTMADSIIRSVTKLLSDSSIGSDSIIRSTNKLLLESDTISDNLIKQTTKNLSDNSTISDTFSTIKILFIQLLESFTSSDIIQKITNKVIQETQTIADNISKGYNKILSEASTIIDSIINFKLTIITLFENITILEDFRIFLNGLEARWKNLFKSKTNSWSDKTSNKNNDWIDKKGL